MDNRKILGWRGKVGLILPSGNAVTEPLLYGLAPDGIAFYTARTYVADTTVEAVRSMEKEKEGAIHELSSLKLDLLVDCCTMSGIQRGFEADQTFCRLVSQETGFRTISTIQAIMEALNYLGSHRLIITSPYREEVEKVEKAFFEQNGFEVINMRGLDIRGGYKSCLIEPREIFRLCEDAWQPGADCVFISCMNFNPVPVLEALELRLKVPVVSSNSATLWKILQMLNVPDHPSGCGMLLSGAAQAETKINRV
jgi:maleate isomerase